MEFLPQIQIEVEKFFHFNYQFSPTIRISVCRECVCGISGMSSTKKLPSKHQSLMALLEWKSRPIATNLQPRLKLEPRMVWLRAAPSSNSAAHPYLILYEWRMYFHDHIHHRLATEPHYLVIVSIVDCLFDPTRAQLRRRPRWRCELSSCVLIPQRWNSNVPWHGMPYRPECGNNQLLLRTLHSVSHITPLSNMSNVIYIRF